MHSKFLLAGPYLVIGGTSWASASKGNHETSVLPFLNPEGWRAMRSRCDRLRQGSSYKLQGQSGLEELGRLVEAKTRTRSSTRTSVNTPAVPGAGVGSLPPDNRWAKYVEGDRATSSKDRKGNKGVRESLNKAAASL